MNDWWIFQNGVLVNKMTDLKARFSYMFEAKNIGIGTSTGWFPIFEKLCEDIDTYLGDEKMNFAWVQCKEKFGGARFYFYMDLKEPEVDEDKGIAPSSEELAEHARRMQKCREVQKLVDKATGSTRETCMVCGKPGDLDQSHPYVLTLCDHHKGTRDTWSGKIEIWLGVED